jgi:hypothetical protein
MSRRRQKGQVSVWFCFFARDPADNSLWDYAVREVGKRMSSVVTDLDELTPLVRAGKVEAVLALNLNELGHSVSPLVQVLRTFVTHDVALIVPSRPLILRACRVK